MEDSASQAAALSSREQKQNITDMQTSISEFKENQQKIRTLCAERGFQETEGFYLSFLKDDAAATPEFETLSSSAWTDGKWIDFTSSGSIEMDGKTFTKMTYDADLPQPGKRNYILARIGGNGVIYSGDIYLANMSFSGGSTASLDIAGMDAEALNGSFGNGLGTISNASISALLDEMITAASNYSTDEAQKSTIVNAITAKQEAYTNANAADQQILKLKTENIQLSSALTEQSNLAKDNVNEATAAAKTNTSVEIERAVDEISKGAVSQASDIEEAATSISDMADSFDKIVSNIGHLNEITEEMRKMAIDSSAFMTELANSNKHTAQQQFVDLEQRVRETSNSTDEIREYTSVCDDARGAGVINRRLLFYRKS